MPITHLLGTNDEGICGLVTRHHGAEKTEAELIAEAEAGNPGCFFEVVDELPDPEPFEPEPFEPVPGDPGAIIAIEQAAERKRIDLPRVPGETTGRLVSITDTWQAPALVLAHLDMDFTSRGDDDDDDLANVTYRLDLYVDGELQTSMAQVGGVFGAGDHSTHYSSQAILDIDAGRHTIMARATVLGANNASHFDRLRSFERALTLTWGV